MKATKNDLMNGLKYYSDYIKNKKQVLSILESKNIELKYEGRKDDQYNYSLIINDKKFKYFEGLAYDPLNEYNIGLKIIIAIDCLLSDMSYSNYSLDDLFNELCYKKPSEAIKVLNDIKDNTNKLKMLFSQDELDLLSNNMEL